MRDDDSGQACVCGGGGRQEINRRKDTSRKDDPNKRDVVKNIQSKQKVKQEADLRQMGRADGHRKSRMFKMQDWQADQIFGGEQVVDAWGDGRTALNLVAGETWRRKDIWVRNALDSNQRAGQMGGTTSQGDVCVRGTSLDGPKSQQ